MARIEIVQFPARADNFGVLVHDTKTGATAAIDAPDSETITAALGEHGWSLTHILVTHKHLDHIEGVPALRTAFGCEVVGPAASAVATGAYDCTVSGGDTFEWSGAEIRVIATPGHTLDHIAYWFADDAAVFVGDTIFALGCGRVIEGTHAMMWDSIRRLRELPDATALYCGHEYTLANARFAVTIEPDNAALRDRLTEAEGLRANGRATLPTTIGREKAANPFLRADEPAVAAALGLAGASAAEVFAEIRTRKDRF